MFSPYSTPAHNHLQTSFRTITTNLPYNSQQPQPWCISSHPQVPCWDLKPVHSGSLFSKSRVRRGRTSSPPFQGRRLTQSPGHSLSPPRSGAAAPGPAQTSGSPGAPGQAAAHTPTTRARGHGVDPRATPNAPIRAGAGPPHRHSPGSRCWPLATRRLAVTPAAYSRGGSVPARLPRPTPPSGARRAKPGYGESRRHRPLSSLLPQCVPPTGARLVFPGSALS